MIPAIAENLSLQKKNLKGYMPASRARKHNQPSAASVGYPPDIAPVLRQREDLANWFDSPKESRHVITRMGHPNLSMEVVMELQRYYWVRETNQNGIVVGPWQPAWLDKDGVWWPRTIPGWVADAEFKKMFEIHPIPMKTP